MGPIELPFASFALYNHNEQGIVTNCATWQTLGGFYASVGHAVSRALCMCRSRLPPAKVYEAPERPQPVLTKGGRQLKSLYAPWILEDLSVWQMSGVSRVRQGILVVLLFLSPCLGKTMLHPAQFVPSGWNTHSTEIAVNQLTYSDAVKA